VQDEPVCSGCVNYFLGKRVPRFYAGTCEELRALAETWLTLAGTWLGVGRDLRGLAGTWLGLSYDLAGTWL
jgi:hypothetical protein